MTTKKLPWFRMYSEAIDDEKLRLLAFEDRWHFVALLCLKGAGVLDDEDALLKRKVSVKMGVTLDTLDEILRRLREVGLIAADTMQPVKWEERQMHSDSSTDRVRAHREKAKQIGNATETGKKQDGNEVETLLKRSSNGLDTDTEEEKEEEKNKSRTQPRKRGADLSTGSDKAEPATPAEPARLNVAALVAEGVNERHARDWLTIRKDKRLPLTPTAWDAVKAEAALCAMTPAAAVELAVKSGWAGFKSSWATSGAAGTAAGIDAEWHLSMDGIKRRGADLRVKPQQDGEDFLQFKARVFKAAGQGPWIDKLLAEWRGTESMFLSLTEYFNDVRPAAAAA